MNFSIRITYEWYGLHCEYGIHVQCKNVYNANKYKKMNVKTRKATQRRSDAVRKRLKSNGTR